MVSRWPARLPGLLLGAVLLIYPFLVYFLFDELGVRAFALLLAVALCGRLIPVARKKPWLLICGLLVITAFLLLVMRLESLRLLMVYPALISCVLFLVFAATLIRPPSMIEIISLRTGMSVPDAAIGYMRVLTLIWCLFFIFNVAVSLWLAWQGDPASWALYNGVVSYLLIAALLAGEYVFRQFYRKRHGITD